MTPGQQLISSPFVEEVQRTWRGVMLSKGYMELYFIVQCILINLHCVEKTSPIQKASGIRYVYRDV
jgi:hypothetical protein